MIKRIFFVLLTSVLLLSCEKKADVYVVVKTTMGDMSFKLYKETPLHRDNFLKLAADGFYDNQLFHALVPNQYIQTGDPSSKTATRNRLLGKGNSGYTIEQEIAFPKFFNKRGALTACIDNNQSDKKLSSGSQFYVILGKKYTQTELDTIEMDAYNKQLELVWQRLIITNRKQLDELSLFVNDTAKLKSLQDSLVQVAGKQLKHEDVFFFTKEQRAAYTTVGGVPHMDGDYTVFGEIETGMDVLDKISKLSVDRNARPIEDVRILSIQVLD